MNKVSKGLKVIYQGEKAKVILVKASSGYRQCKILLIESRDRKWVHMSDLELDQEFYRDKKLNRLLK